MSLTGRPSVMPRTISTSAPVRPKASCTVASNPSGQTSSVDNTSASGRSVLACHRS